MVTDSESNWENGVVYCEDPDVSCILHLLSKRVGNHYRCASAPKPAILGSDRLAAHCDLRVVALLLPQGRWSFPPDAPWIFYSSGTSLLLADRGQQGLTCHAFSVYKKYLLYKILC